MTRNVISRKVSREQQISGDESGSNSRDVIQLKSHHKPHHKHHKHGKHGHKHGRHHHGKHKKVCKMLSDIPESPNPPEINTPSGNDTSPEINTPSANDTSSGTDFRDHLPVDTDGTDGDRTSDSDGETNDLLPRFSDIEPSSPQLAKDFGALNEPEVSTQGGSAAEEGIDETVM